MTKIQGVGVNKRVGVNKGVKAENQNRKPLLNPKNTGYAAAAALGLTAIRGFSKSKPIAKSHKILGFISAGLTLLHIGCVEYLHHKHKKL